MRRTNKLLCLQLFGVLFLLGAGFTDFAFALVPVVNNVVVWESDGRTILNVTVTHDPVSPPFHHVNRIEVDVNGVLYPFNIIQNVTTFTYSCDLGVIEGTPSATVQAHCTIDGYSLQYNLVIPEFSAIALLLILALCTSFVTFAFRKIKPKYYSISLLKSE